jgi:DNA-binding transcriptional LysR family regulator
MTTSASSVTVAWTVVADRPRAAIARIDNRRLKVKLLNRTTRFVRTTEVGQRYLDDARRILAEADEADEAAAGVNAAPRGHLAITAPVLFGRMFVMPLVVEYLNRYPDTAVSAVLLDRVVNLLEEGVDVGIRIGELPGLEHAGNRRGISAPRGVCFQRVPAASWRAANSGRVAATYDHRVERRQRLHQLAIRRPYAAYRAAAGGNDE